MSECNSIIPKLCGGSKVPYFPVVECEPVEENFRTVLYGDGTFIINESDRHSKKNTSLHGFPQNVYEPLTDDFNYVFANAASRPWDLEVRYVTAIEIGSPISPVDTSYWFRGMINAASADVSQIDTSNTIKMEYMFRDCQSLTELDLSTFDTSSTTSIAAMFFGCTGLVTLDLSNWTFNDDTKYGWSDYYYSSVDYIPKIETIHLNNVDTSGIVDYGFSGMFSYMTNLQSLDLSSFDTSNGKDFSYMFALCGALNNIDCSMFETSNAVNMSRMFYDCTGLVTLDLSNFDTTNVTSMSYMFEFCSSLVALYLCSFDSTNLTNCGNMFGACLNLEIIKTTSAFDCSAVSYTDDMFNACLLLVGGNGTVYNSAHIDGSYGVIDTALTPGYFTDCEQ